MIGSLGGQVIQEVTIFITSVGGDVMITISMVK